MMSVPQAMVLGLVEGLTEYLPVSSTGHLILAQRAMGIGGDNGEKEAADAYAVCIQLGAILAVLGLYAGDIRRIGLGLIGRDPGGLHLGRNLLIAFLPAAIVGLTFVDKIKEHDQSVLQIELMDLEKKQVIDFIKDSFFCSEEQASSLAVIVKEKTGGNPYFLKQFLFRMHDEKQIRLQVTAEGKKEWYFSVREIEKQNVIRL